MKISRLLASKIALPTLLMAAGSMAAAQSGRSWVDPPAESATAPSPPAAQAPEAPQQAPVPPPQTPTRQAEQPPSPPAATGPAPAAPAVTARPKEAPEADKRTARASIAKQLVVDYLNSWSAPNEAALEATAAFYAPRILFHGSEVSMQRLVNEKRRFAQRWPERDYRPREDGIGTACNPAGEICTVHAVFDYSASNPRRRRVSQGTGALQLIVHFIGDRPVIVAEHSTLLGQERRHLAQEGVSND